MRGWGGERVRFSQEVRLKAAEPTKDSESAARGRFRLETSRAANMDAWSGAADGGGLYDSMAHVNRA